MMIKSEIRISKSQQFLNFQSSNVRKAEIQAVNRSVLNIETFSFRIGFVLLASDFGFS